MYVLDDFSPERSSYQVEKHDKVVEILCMGFRQPSGSINYFTHSQDLESHIEMNHYTRKK